MRQLRRAQSSLLRRRKKRTAVVTGAANDESMLFRPPTTMMMQLSPLYGVPSYTDEHANPRNFTVEKLLHALKYLRCRNLSAEEEVFIRHQHDCEMMRLERPWARLRLMLMVDFPIRYNHSRAYGRDCCCYVIAAPEKAPRSDISPQGPM